MHASHRRYRSQAVLGQVHAGTIVWSGGRSIVVLRLCRLGGGPIALGNTGLLSQAPGLTPEA